MARREVTTLFGGLVLVLGACGGQAPEDKTDWGEYSKELHRCADFYVAKGMSRDAAVYGPCSVEVPAPGSTGR